MARVWHSREGGSFWCDQSVALKRRGKLLVWPECGTQEGGEAVGVRADTLRAALQADPQ